MKTLKQAIRKKIGEDCSLGRRKKAELLREHYQRLRRVSMLLYNEVIRRMSGWRLERDGLFFFEIIKAEVVEATDRAFIDDAERRLKRSWMKKYVHRLRTALWDIPFFRGNVT